MKIPQKILSVAIVLTLAASMLGFNVSAATLGAVTTGSGTELTENTNNTVSSLETEINIAYALGDGETDFAEAVSLAKDVVSESVLKVTNPPLTWKSGAITYTADAAIETGIYTLSYTFCSNETTRWYGARFDRAECTGAASGLFYADPRGGAFKFQKSSTANSYDNTNIAYAANNWYRISIAYDLTNNTYAATITDLSTGVSNSKTGNQLNQTDRENRVSGGALTYIRLGQDDFLSDGNYVMFKDIKVEYQASSDSEKVTKASVDFTNGETLADTAATEVISCVPTGDTTSADADPVLSTETVVTSKTDVTYTGSDNAAGTYTLSELELEVGEEYILSVGDSEYPFTVIDGYNASITTGNGAPVTDNGSVDMDEASLVLTYNTVISETDLNSKVVLATDLSKEKLLKVTDPGLVFRTGAITYTADSSVDTGIYTFSYSFCENTTAADSYYGARFDTADGPAAIFYASKGQNAFYRQSSQSGGVTKSGISYTSGNWYNVSIAFNLDTDTYTVTATDLTAGTAEASVVCDQYNATGGITTIRIGANVAYNTGDSVMFKDIKVEYQASSDSAKVTKASADFAKGDTLTETAVTGVISCNPAGDATSTDTDPVLSYEEIIVKTDVAGTAEYTANGTGCTYTITPEDGFEYGKTYSVISGTQITSFTISNVNNHFVLEGIEANGQEIVDGAYLALGNSPIELTFGGDIDKATLDNGVTLTHNAMEDMLHTDSLTGYNYQTGLFYQISETSGTLSIEHRFKVSDETSYYTVRLDGTKADGSSGEVARVAFYNKTNPYLYKTTAGGETGTSGQYTRIVNEWQKIRVDLNIATKQFQVIINDTQYFPSTTGYYISSESVTSFNRINFGEGNKIGVPLSIDDLKITSNDAVVFETDFSNITAEEVKNYIDIGEFSLGSHIDSSSEVECTTAFEDGVYSIAPLEGLVYRDEYVLDVPEMENSDGEALRNPKTLSFTAVYVDSLVASSSAFENASDEKLSTIGTAFTGGITGWARVSNYSGSDVDVKVIVVLYKGNSLEDIDVADLTLTAGAENVYAEATVTVETAGEGYKAVVYVWDNFDDLRPISPICVIS